MNRWNVNKKIINNYKHSPIAIFITGTPSLVGVFMDNMIEYDVKLKKNTDFEKQATTNAKKL